MSALREWTRGRRYWRAAVYAIGLLSLLFLVVACGGTAAPAVEPAPPQPTQEPPETAVPPTYTAVPPTATSAPQPSPLVEKIDSWLAHIRFRGAVLVARGDEIILRKGYGLADEENEVPNTPATRFRIASLTKAFTAMAIMQLQEQGLLEVSDPICDYLDDCPLSWKDITIHHLLTHTSGISSYRWIPGFEEIKATPTPPDQLLDRVKKMSLEFPPGESWAYSDSGYVLLGQIIERVSGRPYADFLQENIFDPLGMAGTGLDPAPDGLALGYATSTGLADPIAMENMYAAAGMYSTVDDLHRWAKALDTEQLVSRPALDLIQTKHALLEGSDEWSYGYGWVIGAIAGHPTIAHPGGIEGVSTSLMRYPEDALTIIMLSNQENTDAPNLAELLAQMIFHQE